jgi:serralysin
MSRPRRLVSLSVVVGMVAALLLATAGPALASTAGISGSSIVFTASPGEANNTEVEGGGGVQFRIEDLGALIFPGPGCSQDGPHHVLCPSVGITSITFDTGDRNDIIVDNTALPSTLKGGCGSDVIEGGSAADTVIGDPSTGCPQVGNDSLDGRDGNDTIVGGPGADTLKGSAGNDRISGGSGQDQIDGGAGSDRIGVVDGEVDTVTCGAGFDSVRADPNDSIASDCEQVVI